MSDVAIADAAMKKKRKKTNDGIPLASVDRLKDLFVENEKIQKLRNENDLLERLIMDPDGTDLRAVVQRIASLVQHTVQQFNALHDRMQASMEKHKEGTISSFMQQKLPAEDVRTIDHLFHSALDGNPNDDKARTAQLAIVFTALTIEIDVRQQLMAAPQHIDRFADASTTEQTVADIVEQEEKAQHQRANQIRSEPLVLFLKHDSRRLLTQFSDKIIPDTRAYVSACIDAYMSYKPAADVHVAKQYYGLPPTNE